MTAPIKSEYQYITNHDALQYTVGRQGQEIRYIVIHHWGNRGQTFEGVLNWFCHNQNCQTSAHYVAEAGKVACIVDLSNTAYHAGNWLYNLQSIGIECRPEATENDYQTVAQLIANLWKAFGKLELIEHRNVPGAMTSCPGIWNLKKLKSLAEQYYNGINSNNKEAKPMKKTIEQPADWAKPMWQKFKAMGFFDGTRPKDSATREELVTIMGKAHDALEKEVELLKSRVAKLEKENK